MHFQKLDSEKYLLPVLEKEKCHVRMQQRKATLQSLILGTTSVALAVAGFVIVYLSPWWLK